MRGRVPEGWVEVELGEVGDWFSGGTPSKARPEFWGPGVPWVSPKDMKSFRITASEDQITEAALAQTSLRMIPEGSVLVVVRSGILARTLPVGITSAPVTINQDLKAIVPNNDIDPSFLGWFLRSAENSILRSCAKSGTTVSSIKTAALRNVRAPLAPLPEQRRIVAKIEELFSELDAGAAALERAQAKLERYRASVLKAAVEGRLTEQWRKENPPEETGEDLLKRILAERRKRWEEGQLAAFEANGKAPPKEWREKYKEPEGPDTRGLAELPEGWCWGTVEQVGSVQLGRQRSPKHHQGPHMRPYLRVANVFEDRIDVSDVKYMNFTPEEAERYELSDGDILLNEGQSAELVGRPARYRDELPGGCFTNTLVRFKAYPGLDPDYALLVFRAHLRNGQFRKIARITTNIAHLGAERLRTVPFPLPPIREQQILLERARGLLDGTSLLEASARQTMSGASTLRQSILKLAFEGRLVPQDSNDEPASVLLERIRASRKAEEPTAKRPRKRKSRQGSLDR